MCVVVELQVLVDQLRRVARVSRRAGPSRVRASIAAAVLVAAAVCVPGWGDGVAQRLFEHAEDRVNRAASLAQAEGDFSVLEAVEGELRTTRTPDSGDLRYYRSYWLAYAKYRRAGAMIAAGQPEGVKSVLEEAMALLENIEPQDSDSEALFGLVAGMSLGFVEPSAMFERLAKVTESLANALSLDESNVRAWYANAMSDFSTPPEFGGGKRAERYLRKAIAAQTPPSVLGPNWGRKESVGLLLEIYFRDERLEDAQALLEEAVVEFPGSASLTSYGERLAMANGGRVAE